MHFRSGLAIGLLGMLMAIVGCGKDGPTLYPVTGKLLYKGQPAEGASVNFIPTGDIPASMTASGRVSADGTFTLETYPHGAGAVAGDYKVVVTWMPENARQMENPKNKLPAKYADQNNSGLTATVKAEPTELPPFELN